MTKSREDLRLPAAERSYVEMVATRPHGAQRPSPQYLEARAAFLAALRDLDEAGVARKVVAEALGITSSAVSQWMQQGRDDA